MQKLLVGGKTFQLNWAYDELGYLDTLLYPDSRLIRYSPNALGQPTRVGDYVNNISYHATGALASYDLANGVTRTFTRDELGNPNQILDKKGGANRVKLDYVYDKELNVKNIYDRMQSSFSVTNLGYDGLNRLVRGDGNWGTGSFTYDNRNNLTRMQTGSSTLNYNYSSNLLQSVTGTSSRNYQYDSRGNVTNDGTKSYVYDSGNRLKTSAGFGFGYDANGLRVEKTIYGLYRHYVYADGKLLHISDDNGEAKNYIYLQGSLIAKDIGL